MRIWLFDRWPTLLLVVAILVVIGILVKTGFACDKTIWYWVDKHEGLVAGVLVSVIMMLGLIGTFKTTRTMIRDHELEILLNLSRYWDTGLGMEVQGEIARITITEEGNLTDTLRYYRSNYPKEYHHLLSIPNFFEDMGYLTKHKHIHLGAIMALYKEPIKRYYSAYEAYITDFRQEERRSGIKPQTYDYFRWLAKKAGEKIEN